MIAGITHPDRIQIALEQALGSLKQVSQGIWTSTLTAGSRVVTVRRVADWLMLEGSLDNDATETHLAPETLAELLRRNAVLHGGAKFSLAGRGRRVLSTAELPLDEDLDLELRLRETCWALAGNDADEFAASKRGPIEQTSNPSDSDANEAASVDESESLAGLIEEVGWPFHQRVAGQFVVRLEVGDQFQQASLARQTDEGYRLWTSLETPPGISPRSRQAINLVLLMGCRLIRMVRAADTSDHRENGYAWEMVWHQRPTACELRHALSAMSVACRITAQEVQALCDEELANDYLAARGWSSQAAG